MDDRMATLPARPAARRETARGRQRPGPSWVGIGAQRCGTTWFTEMLCMHPDVGLAEGGGKELHFFDRFLADEWTPGDRDRYRALFAEGVVGGEFTPAYLRSPWVAPLLREACGPDTLLLVLLRDPVERFRSGVRWALSQGSRPGSGAGRHAAVRRLGGQALWAGMYATQLDAWERHFDRDRIVVLQYERVVSDPVRAVASVWSALGVPVIPFDAPRARTWNTNQSSGWTEPPGLADSLRSLYAPEVARLAAERDIDVSLWPNF